METTQIQAYARGWHDADDWHAPHLNPYPNRSPEWEAWAVGYDDRRTGRSMKLEPCAATCNNNM